METLKPSARRDFLASGNPRASIFAPIDFVPDVHTQLQGYLSHLVALVQEIMVILRVLLTEESCSPACCQEGTALVKWMS